MSNGRKGKATAKMQLLERALAYEHASCIVDSESMVQPEGWREVDIEGEVDLFDAVQYLEWRGLLERHPALSNWVRVRDESEATN